MTAPLWYHLERGSGRPLVLLHGIGMSHAAWAPVIDRLAGAKRRVIAFDLAGFGRSAPLPDGTAPTHENLLAALEQNLAKLGIRTPVDIAGNSLGGQLALVAAREGVARSVVALSPAGLWAGPESPASVRLLLRAMRLAALRIPPNLSDRLMRSKLARTIAFAVPLTSRGWRIGAEEAALVTRAFREAVAFDETLAAAQRFTGGSRIKVPVTVAFGTRDWLLPKRHCQVRDELPAQARWVRPRGWGHVPMWDDPAGVASLILAGTT